MDRRGSRVERGVLNAGVCATVWGVASMLAMRSVLTARMGDFIGGSVS
jgi:hypothetical protein